MTVVVPHHDGICIHIPTTHCMQLSQRTVANRKRMRYFHAQPNIGIDGVHFKHELSHFNIMLEHIKLHDPFSPPSRVANVFDHALDNLAASTIQQQGPSVLLPITSSEARPFPSSI
jgi:hypothetical protein